MASVFNVAKYILEKQGDMTAMKLQKLVYYSQAWHAVWEEKPLYNDEIQAWINGPVIPNLYNLHRGQFIVSAQSISEPSNILSHKEKDSIDKVLDFYGEKSSQWLSDLTHSEEPWIQAREGLTIDQRGSNVISLRSMVEYYESL